LYILINVSFADLGQHLHTHTTLKTAIRNHNWFHRSRLNSSMLEIGIKPSSVLRGLPPAGVGGCGLGAASAAEVVFAAISGRDIAT
jgi:hypothetical protein